LKIQQQQTGKYSAFASSALSHLFFISSSAISVGGDAKIFFGARYPKLRHWMGGRTRFPGPERRSRCPCFLLPGSDYCKDWTHSLLFVGTGSFSRLPLLPDFFGFLEGTGPSPSYPL